MTHNNTPKIINIDDFEIQLPNSEPRLQRKDHINKITRNGKQQLAVEIPKQLSQAFDQYVKTHHTTKTKVLQDFLTTLTK